MSYPQLQNILQDQNASMRSGMNRILLLIAPESRDPIEKLLEQDYVLVYADDGNLAASPIDVCIIDAAGLDTHREALHQLRDQERPIFLPVLLVTSGEERDHRNIAADPVVDEIITLPLSAAELAIRLSTLLRQRQLTAANKDQHEKLSLIGKAIDSSSDAIIITDIKGRMLFCNPAFLQLYNSPNNSGVDTQGILEPMFVNPEAGQEVFNAVRRGQSWNGEVELRGRDGQSVFTLLQADTVKDDEQKPIGIVSVYTNITEHRRMKSAEAEQRNLAEALRDTATTLTSTLDLTEVFERILTNVGRVVAHDTANIMIIEDGVGRIMRSRGYTRRRMQDVIAEQRFPVEATPHLKQMFDTRQTLIIPDTLAYPNKNGLMLSPDWPRSYAGAPIWLNDEVIGFINLESDIPDFFNPIHADRLRAFAEQAAIAIQNARLYEQSKALAVLQERQRLGRDLHDSVSQTLFSATMIAEALPRLWERDPERVRQQLSQLHRLMRGALAETRTFLLELRPDNLRDMELPDLLQQLAQAVWGRKWIEVSLNVEGDYKLPLDVKLAFYRVAQEALTNVVKHARASQVDIQLELFEEGVHLTIADNGRGFNPDNTSPKSMGLKIMREHAAGGNIDLAINAEIDQGTEVDARWKPLEG